MNFSRLLAVLALLVLATTEAHAVNRFQRKPHNCSAEILFRHSAHGDQIAIPARKTIVLQWPLDSATACHELINQALPRARAVSAAAGNTEDGGYVFQFNPGSSSNCRHLSCSTR